MYTINFDIPNKATKVLCIFASITFRDMKQIKLTAPTETIQAVITLPSSKSICNRALIVHALSGGQDSIANLSDCDDTQVMMRALQDLPETIDIQAAGTAMRFLTAYFSVTQGEHTLTGTERMKQRPIRILVEALRSLGAEISYTAKEGFPPLHIKGNNLLNSEVSLPGNISSQYISALLLIAPMLTHGLKLTLTGEIVSRPYIQLTLQLMQQFGAEAGWISPHQLEVKPKPYRSIPFTVESDWSAASYWYEIVALSADATVTLPALYAHSFQGDAKVAQLFEDLGVHTHYQPEGIILTKKERSIQQFTYDFVDQPDLAQTFVVTCAMLNIPFHFSGLQSLKIKETDRIAALITEMKKLGYQLTEANDSELIWNGERCPASAQPAIDTYEDHRMAMAFAPAALQLKELRINNPHVVTKSYPHYWEHITHAGFGIKEEN